jgi:hypothetical protein
MGIDEIEFIQNLKKIFNLQSTLTEETDIDEYKLFDINNNIFNELNTYNNNNNNDDVRFFSED